VYLETETPPLNFYEVEMRRFIYESWNSVMNHDVNPLKHIPDLNVRHMVMQILAWMWCVAFSMYFGSMWVFGFTAIAHLIIIGAIVVTVATFKITQDMDWGYRTPSRSRAIYHNGKRIPLDPRDVGGEHE
tara:strand:- start:459 stop:848 length:390 start_codon:yes stop_codon:yes gene_type:complete